MEPGGRYLCMMQEQNALPLRPLGEGCESCAFHSIVDGGVQPHQIGAPAGPPEQGWGPQFRPQLCPVSINSHSLKQRASSTIQQSPITNSSMQGRLRVQQSCFNRLAKQGKGGPCCLGAEYWAFSCVALNLLRRVSCCRQATPKALTVVHDTSGRRADDSDPFDRHLRVPG